MKKTELKNILKPLIKECIKEVIFEEGTLSTIISEVLRGTSEPKPITEIKKEKPTNTHNQKKLEEIKRRKKKLLDSIGQDAYNGVNLFEGTTPTPSAAKESHGPLRDVEPNDAGIDISGIFSGTSSAIWKKMSGK